MRNERALFLEGKTQGFTHCLLVSLIRAVDCRIYLSYTAHEEHRAIIHTLNKRAP